MHKGILLSIGPFFVKLRRTDEIFLAFLRAGVAIHLYDPRINYAAFPFVHPSFTFSRWRLAPAPLCYAKRAFCVCAGSLGADNRAGPGEM